MNRDNKIQTLKAVMNGQINPTPFQPTVPYIFITRNDKPGVYERNGVKYNESEYLALCGVAHKNKIVITQICESW